MKSKKRPFSNKKMILKKNFWEENQIFIIDEKNSLFDEKISIFISPKETISSLRKIIRNRIPNHKQKLILAYERKSVNDCPSDIILRGKKLINLSKYIKFDLVFNGVILKDNAIIEKSGIQNLSYLILLTNVPQVEGGRIFNFVDLRKNNIEKINLSKKAPSYRVSNDGLNLLGLCTNKECKTKGKEVIVPCGFGEFDLGHAIEEMDIRCPICSQVVKPKTCGFISCAYNFIGSILENGKEEPFKSKTYEAPSDYFTYYKPSENLGKWLNLKIYTLSNKSSETLSTASFKDLEYFDC